MAMGFGNSADAARTQPAPRGLRVLVVEDHPDVAFVLQTLLKHAGHEACWAASGKAALEAIGQFQPTVALLDIGLPDMNGYELAQHLRSATADDTLGLVALSGNDDAEHRRRSQVAGFAFHLAKPPDWAELVRVLQHFSDRRAQHLADAQCGSDGGATTSPRAASG